jgi:hypothetical protein
MMHDKRIEAYATRVVALAEASAETFDPNADAFHVSDEHDPPVVLMNETARALNDFVRELLKNEVWARRLSERTVRKAIVDVVRAVVARPGIETAKEELRRLVERLEGCSVERRVLVPLDGIILDMDPKLGPETIAFGPVVVRKMTDAQIDTVVAEVSESLVLEPEEQRSEYLALLRHQLVTELKGRVCADCIVVGDAARAQEIAEIRALRVVDLLRYAIPALYARGHRVAVGLLGDVPRGRRSVVTVARSSGTLDVKSDRVGALWELNLNNKTIEVLRTIGVMAMAESLASERRTQLEEGLWRAIHWFADAQAQHERANQLTSLVTALESLFSEKGGAPIRLTIAEGTAVIGTEGLTKRKALKEFVGGMYNKRNNTTHGGSADLTDADIAILTRVVGAVIQALISRKDSLRGPRALAIWLEDERLRGKSDCQ